MTVPDDLYNYSCSHKGLLLPIINEYTWSEPVRAFLYIVGLLWCFMGVAIIADVFMCAIEKITSKTRLIRLATVNEDEPETFEVRVWNDTVANLTLMALGSSAPEILLSCIEVIGNGFNVGELGPSTIVGSAAFNLLIISAVCIVSIPKGESRSIKHIKVFATTAFFSLFAYIWLLFILVWNTPHIVDLWEAVVTFLLFPVCVLLAYLADRDFFRKKRAEKDKQMELGFATEKDSLLKNGKLDKKAVVGFMREVRKYPGLTNEDAAMLAASRLVEETPHSRMWYRIGAIRDISGSRRTRPSMSAKLRDVYTALEEHGERVDGIVTKPITNSFRETNALVEFHAAMVAVCESIGKFPVIIRRHGHTGNTATVRVESLDGTAVEGEDYIKLDELITFLPNETEKEVQVEIVNDNQWEPDEVFFLKLTVVDDTPGVVVGRISVMEITILNDDEPGILLFQKRGFLVRESCGIAAIPVIRKNGSDGEVSVKWRTIDKSARSGKDYTGGCGVLLFKHTETELVLEIPIINDLNPEKDEHFEIELFEPTGGAELGSINRTIVTITNDDDFNSMLERVIMMTNANVDALQLHTESWSSQFKEAMNVNGGDVENANAGDYLMHFLTFFWKVLFAFVPPPGILGGWLCFTMSLIMIGILTAIIGDLAGISGCLLGIPDNITAITLVAAGTSLPDLFASKTAASTEKYADNAIGNVTGSNSVNVFLGLGLPWLIAACYWFAKDDVFRVNAGSLGFTVGVYTVVSCLALLLLVARRVVPFFGRGELGGPSVPRYISAAFLLSLWAIYLLLSILDSLDTFK